MPMRAGRQPAHGIEAVASCAEIAAELGCSKARVQQIETQALAKLRAALAQRGYDIEDLIETRHACRPHRRRAPVDADSSTRLAKG